MIDVAGKRVTVAGLGHFGGGIAVARWLVTQGAQVLVTDKASNEQLAGAVQQLAGLPIEFRLGVHHEADFTSADLIVASPAIPPTNAFLAAARDKGVPITTEICLFVDRCPAKVIAVTGTKGKSTTSAMLGRILSKQGTTWLGGNIGKSLLDDLPHISSSDLVILELSSFMLHYLGEMKWSPAIAVVTLLAPDHLDWHGSFHAYASAKQNIIRWQKPGDCLVVNEESPALIKWIEADATEHLLPSGSIHDRKIVRYGVDGRRAFDLRVPGRHNQLNAQGAFAAASTLGVTWDQAQAALVDFLGLPHRLELVHESAGVRWFNDSIATIPEAAVAAMQAFSTGTVIQIVGGKDKGLDLTPMIGPLAASAKIALTIGQTGQEVGDMLRKIGGRAEDVRTLAAAVARAKELAKPGDVVLLSPGFASYDQFMNFEERGKAFARLLGAS